MKCPACSAAIADHLRACPSCGAVLFDSLTPTLARPKSGFVDDARFVPGTILNERYRIIGLLGKGGMGEVYRADDLKLGQPVALKFLPLDFSDDAAALARFHHEVRTARQVSHPNVCRVFDIGEAGGQSFLSMEYVDGEDLASLLRRIDRLPADKALQIARQICAGLAAAHDNGVLHRDLKPANIMIDGRGRARITDFGLAGLAEEFRDGDLRAGTPAYMAPEQLSGSGISVRSDLYSLGLVLYELFTGRRAWEASSPAELSRLRKATPPSLSNWIKDIDPLVERVIMRCLQPDPAARPASALQVAAALPGGDPLAAALAAGETPSPEMVAAAHKEGALRPAVAVACLVALLLGLAVAVTLSDRISLHRRAGMRKSPEVLAEHARSVVRQLGYSGEPGDTAYGFSVNSAYLRYVSDNDSSPRRWDKLAANEPPAIYFWYRESPQEMVPRFANNWRVGYQDPPPLLSGMINLLLDPQGRLNKFRAAPPETDAAPGDVTPADWSPLFAAAGLDRARFTPATPLWVPTVHGDARAAWLGHYPNQPGTEIRIEAASYRGKPVYFGVLGPWNKPAEAAARPRTATRIGQFMLMLLTLTMMLSGVWVARRNLRLGRGDSKGATRLAAFVFLTLLLAWVFRASHISGLVESGEFNLFLSGILFALFISGFLWVLYVAVEPYLRRRWPHRIISWNRLLTGSIRDPLVGRDLLIGALFGVAMALAMLLPPLAAELLGQPEPLRSPVQNTLETLLGTRGLIGTLLYNHLPFCILLGLASVFLLLLVFMLLRREWLTIGVTGLLITGMQMLSGQDTRIALVSGVVLSALVLILLTRFGLLAAIAAFFFTLLCTSYPLTWDFSVWYWSNSLIVLVIGVALAAYAFHTSLAGQPLFRGGILEE
ncbi:MAG: serine/threonine-protein kinase [Acidobacteriota bacterium]